MRKPRDSNPEAAQHDHRFSRPADYQLSQTSKFNFLWAQVKLRNFLVYNEQCLRSAAPYNIFIHPSWCTLLRGVRTSFIFLEPLVGPEPTTSSLQVRCNYQLCYRGNCTGIFYFIRCGCSRNYATTIEALPQIVGDKGLEPINLSAKNSRVANYTNPQNLFFSYKYIIILKKLRIIF